MKKLFLLSCLLCIMAADAIAGYNPSISYRWRKDNGNEKTATDLGENLISNRDPIRLRANFDNSSDTESVGPEYLGYSLTCDGITLTDDTTTKAPFVLYRSNYVKNGEATTYQMYGYGTFFPGVFVSAANKGGITLQSRQMSEVEWCIKPTRYVKPLAEYTFRPDGLHYRFQGITIRTSENIVPPGNPADKITALSYEPVADGLSINFKTSLNKHNAISIKIGRWPNNLKVIKTLEKPVGTSFKEVISPAIVTGYGDYYIAFELIDENGAVTTSSPVKYNIKPYVVLSSFSVKPTNDPTNPKRVEVKITTSAMYFPYMYLRASDNSDARDSNQYAIRKEVIQPPGKGIYAHNKLTTFTFFDEVLDYDKPRHFVVEYPQFHKRMASRVITVKIPKPLAVANAAQSFSIYPNPANSGKVSFDLKGYTGKTLTATLTNLQGKAVSKETFNVNSSENYTLKTNTAAGTYVLNVSGNGVSKAGKVLVQ